VQKGNYLVEQKLLAQVRYRNPSRTPIKRGRSGDLVLLFNLVRNGMEWKGYRAVNSSVPREHNGPQDATYQKLKPTQALGLCLYPKIEILIFCNDLFACSRVYNARCLPYQSVYAKCYAVFDG